MEDYIYHQQQVKEIKKENIFYSSIKNYDFIDKDNNPRVRSESDDRVMAKIKSSPTKYLIRLDNLKKLYDPSTEMAENKNNNLFDDNKIIFKEVNKKTFDYYLSFLRTMNISWIRNAEREDF